jgi:hypothetical protein
MDIEPIKQKRAEYEKALVEARQQLQIAAVQVERLTGAIAGLDEILALEVPAENDAS